MKLIKISRDPNVKTCTKVDDYITPDIVYVPVDINSEVFVKINQNVYKEQVLARSASKYFYSPVSGNILGARACLDKDGKKINTIVIKNNYKEQIESKKKIKISDKDSLTEYLTEYRLNNLLNKINKKNTKLVINALEDELYVDNISMYINNRIDELLYTLQKLYDYYKFEKIYICIKDTDSIAIRKLRNKLGSFVHIVLKLLPDNYGFKDDKVLNEHYFQGNDIIILSIYDVIKLYNIIKKERITTKKYITISGNLVVKPKVINVKIGSSLQEVLKANIRLKKTDDIHYIVNGLMKGKKMDISDLIVTDELESVIINTIDKSEESICINCGLCKEVCPMKIDPRHNLKRCNKCNLCTYICPAKIDILKRGVKK